MRSARHLPALILIALAVLAQPAQAHGGPRSYGTHHGHHGERSWSTPALVLGAIAGAGVIYATRPHQPVVTYASPPPSWYYCASAGAYYPYAQICPEGWQIVPAQRNPGPPPTFVPAPGW